MRITSFILLLFICVSSLFAGYNPAVVEVLIDGDGVVCQGDPLTVKAKFSSGSSSSTSASAGKFSWSVRLEMVAESGNTVVYTKEGISHSGSEWDSHPLDSTTAKSLQPGKYIAFARTRRNASDEWIQSSNFAFVVAVNTVSSDKEKMLCGETVSYTATINPSQATWPMKSPIWQYREMQSDGNYPSDWSDLGKVGATVQVEDVERPGIYQVRAIVCESTTVFPQPVEVRVYPRLNTLTFRSDDLTPVQKPYSNVAARSVEAELTWVDTVPWIFFDVKYDLVNVDSKAVASTNSVKAVKGPFTVPGPARYKVVASVPEHAPCGTLETESIIRYALKMSPARHSYDWGSRDGLVSQFNPLTDKVQSNVTLAEEIADKATKAKLAAEVWDSSAQNAQFALNKSISDLEQAKLDAKDGPDAQSLKSKGEWGVIEGDALSNKKTAEIGKVRTQAELAEVEAKLASATDSGIIKSLTEKKKGLLRTISKLDSQISAADTKITQARSFISALQDFEDTTNIKITAMKAKVKEYTSIFSKDIGLLLQVTQAQSVTNAAGKLLDSPYLSKVQKFSGAVLDLAGFYFDYKTAQGAYDAYKQVDAKAEAGEKLSEETKAAIENFAVTREKGPKVMGTFTVQTTPGGVGFYLSEPSQYQQWTTKSDLYDAEGNAISEENDVSGWSNIFTLEPSTNSLYGQTLTSPTGATGTLTYSIYAHGNLGSSIIYAYDPHTDELSDPLDAFVSCRSTGLTEAELVSMADTIKGDWKQTMERAKAIIDGALAVVSSIVSAVTLIAVAVGALSAGTAALIGLAVLAISSFVSFVLSFFASSNLATSIKRLYP